MNTLILRNILTSEMNMTTLTIRLITEMHRSTSSMGYFPPLSCYTRGKMPSLCWGGEGAQAKDAIIASKVTVREILRKEKWEVSSLTPSQLRSSAVQSCVSPSPCNSFTCLLYSDMTRFDLTYFLHFTVSIRITATQDMRYIHSYRVDPPPLLFPFFFLSLAVSHATVELRRYSSRFYFLESLH